MRIAFVTLEYPPRLNGGAGVYAENLVRSLAELGHEVRVYVPYLGKRPVIDRADANVEVRWVRQPLSGIIGLAFFTLKVAKELECARDTERFDIVHLNGIAFLVFRDRAMGPTYVSTGHHLAGDTAKKGSLRFKDRVASFQGENGFLVPLLERYGAHITDHYLAVSQETREGLQRLYRVPGSAIDVVWNGVDGRAAPSGTHDREEIRERLGLPAAPVLLFVGRVDDPRKGLDNLIKALACFPPERNVKLVAVGGGNAEKARMLAEQLGIKDRVVFMGRVSQEVLWNAYLVADAYICASYQEGFGLTILEALCARCPVISTEVGVAPEIRERLEGVVPTKEPEALRNAISILLMRREARPRFGEVEIPYDFSWKRCAKLTVAGYEKAISMRGDRARSE